MAEDDGRRFQDVARAAAFAAIALFSAGAALHGAATGTIRVARSMSAAFADQPAFFLLVLGVHLAVAALFGLLAWRAFAGMRR
ncbi:MAG: hypothetical protein IPL88_13995 [Rhizobiales bacterium]|nr:hypothetical protein [Hyphomicrobiales bacterium]